jgi:Polyketide cyclase / dehydrase and lipid transport
MMWLRWRPPHRITARNEMRFATLIVLYLTALQVDALDIKELQISENGGLYHIRLVAVIDAPAEYVHRVLTDYVHLHRLHPSIIQDDILASPGNGVVRVRTRMLDCIFIFCVELDRVEDVREVSPYDLHSVVVPSLSNFRSGEADWHIDEMGDRSQVVYEAQMEPDFTIVPIIGPIFIVEKLRDEMASSLARIECIAKIEEELDWNPQLRAAGVDVDTLCGQ